MYEVLIHEHGISTPLYFSILKLHIIVLIILGLSFGIYFCYLTSKICSDEQFWQDHNYHDRDCPIQFTSFILP